MTLKVRPEEVTGLSAMMITPAKEGADDILFEGNTVNLDEAARVANNMVNDGVGSFALCGTTGEGHSLTWEEKVSFIDTMVQVNKDRVPIFAGATTLGTRATINEMKALRDLGAPGAFVGLALWQTPTIENASNWYRDLSEAVPDMGIMVYSNSRFFKTDFPEEFWMAVVAKAPTVVTCKISSAYIRENLAKVLRVAGDKLTFLGGGSIDDYNIFQQVGAPWRGTWSTAVNGGPEPLVAQYRAMAEGDLKRAAEITADIRSVPSHTPLAWKSMFTFNHMNVQAERMRAKYSDYMDPGPLRPPYTDVPPEWEIAGKACGEGWAEMRKKYIKAVV